MADMEVKADGDDHKVRETAYWDTLNVQIVDAHTVAIIAKKGGRTMLTEERREDDAHRGRCDFSRR